MPTESNLQESLREIIQRGSSSGLKFLSTTASLSIALNSAILLYAVRAFDLENLSLNNSLANS